MTRPHFKLEPETNSTSKDTFDDICKLDPILKPKSGRVCKNLFGFVLCCFCFKWSEIERGGKEGERQLAV